MVALNLAVLKPEAHRLVRRTVEITESFGLRPCNGVTLGFVRKQSGERSVGPGGQHALVCRH